MFRLLPQILFLSACLAAVSTAADEAGGLKVRALLLIPSGPATNFHSLSGDVAGEAVMIGASGLSDPFKPAAREFSLALPDAKKESGFREVAKVVLPEQGKDFILLLEPAGATFKVHTVNARESRFGADCVLFFNATKSNLAATLGATKVLIKPRMAVFAKAPLRGVKPYYQVTFYEPDAGKARPFANTRWPHRKESRCYVFLYRNAAGHLTYQAVDEELTPVAPAE